MILLSCYQSPPSLNVNNEFLISYLSLVDLGSSVESPPQLLEGNVPYSTFVTPLSWDKRLLVESSGLYS